MGMLYYLIWEPVKIKYLAEQLIRLSGLTIKDKNNGGDIEIIYTGLRSGEKLYEELLDGKSEPTQHPLIFKAKEKYPSLKELNPKINKLKEFIYSENKDSCFKLLAEMVPEWK